MVQVRLLSLCLVLETEVVEGSKASHTLVTLGRLLQGLAHLVSVGQQLGNRYCSFHQILLQFLWYLSQVPFTNLPKNNHITQVVCLTVVRDQCRSQSIVNPVTAHGLNITLTIAHPSSISILCKISFVASPNLELFSKGNSWKCSPSLVKMREYKSTTVHPLSSWHPFAPHLAILNLISK